MEPAVESLVSSTVVEALVEVLEEEEVASSSRLEAALSEKRRLQLDHLARLRHERRLIEQRVCTPNS